MNDLETLIVAKGPPGIYRLMSRAAPETISQRVERHGWRCFVLNGDSIDDKASFLNASATALHFPKYAGKNWDAFEECLNDLSWISASGYILLYDNVENFARNAANEWSTAQDILATAITRWQTEQIPFIILMRKTGNFVRGLPKLTLS